MADYVEKWGDDVESAIELALKDLKLTRDEVTYTVIEEPSRGFLGLFNKKLAKVRVEKKKIKTVENTGNIKDITDAEDNKDNIKKVGKIKKTEENDKIEKAPKVEKKVKSVQKGNHAPVRASYESDEEIHTIKKKEQFEKNSVKPEVCVEKVPETVENVPVRKNEDDSQKTDIFNTKFSITPGDAGVIDASNEPGINFIKQMSFDMGLDVEIEGSILDDVLYINLAGKDVGTMIGKRGQTLDAVQYLTSIVQNKNRDGHLRVIVNAENYREKREKTLRQLANRLAEKCIWSGRNVRLEPMNPYERKVIHSTLQSNTKVRTRSEGVEPNRRVVIENTTGKRKK